MVPALLPRRKRKGTTDSREPLVATGWDDTTGAVD